MSDFTFPIPAGQARLDQVEQALSENAGDIARVLQPLGEGIAGAIIDNGKDLTSVVGRIKRPLGKALKANQADLAQVLGPLANQLDDAIAMNRSQLGTVESVAGPQRLPVGWPNCPPGTHPDKQTLTCQPDAPAPPIIGAPPGALPPAPAPAPGAPFWFCYQAPGTTSWVVESSQQRGGLFSNPPPGAQVTGPYATVLDAIDACASNVKPAPAPAPSPPVPVPPQPGPPVDPGPPIIAPPTPGPTPSPGINPPLWHVVCLSGGLPGIANWQVVDQATYDLLPANTVESRRGPYANLADAEADAKERQDKGEPCEDLPPTNTCITKCELPGALKGGIPSPGSPDWCRLQDQIIQLLGDAGNTIIEFVLTGTNDALQTAIDAAPNDPSFTDLAGKLLKYLRPTLVDVQCFVARMLDCWRQLASANSECKPQTLVGILALRALLKALRGIDVGISLGVHATVRLDLQLIQVERAVDYIAEAACPSKMPSVGDAVGAWKQGQIDRQTRDCWMKANGVSPEVWAPIIASGAQTVGADGWQEYITRLGGDESARALALLDHGWVRQSDLDAAIALWRKVPELDSWVEWNARNVLDPTAVARYGLLTDFDDFFWPQAEFGTTIKGRSKEAAQRRYAASWSLPNHASARELLHRLRPGKDGVDLPFTREDYRAMLQFEHLAPPAQRWVDAVAYRVLSEGQLQALLEWHLIDGAAWQSGMKDLGFDDDTVRLLWAKAQQDYARQRASATHGWTIQTAVRAVRQGALAPEQLEAALLGQGYSTDEIETALRVEQTSYLGRAMDRAAQRTRLRVQSGVMNAYQIGTVDASAATSTLVSVGYAPASAAAILAAVDLAVTAQVAAKVIQAMRHAYLRGEISLVQAGALLDQAGIQQTRSRQLLAEWEIEFGTKRPMLATSHILKMVGEGLMPTDVANQRLRNLGWASPDRELVEAEVTLQLNKKSAQAVSKAQRRQPESKLRKWFIQRVPGIDQGYITARLRYYGYDDATITYLLESWEADRAKAEKPKPPKPPKPAVVKRVPLATLRAWFFNREIEMSNVRERLAESGYLDEDIALFADEWQQQRDFRDEKPKPPAPA